MPENNILTRYNDLKARHGLNPDNLIKFINHESEQAFAKYTDIARNQRKAVQTECLEFYQELLNDVDEIIAKKFEQAWPRPPFIIELGMRMYKEQENALLNQFPYNLEINLTKTQETQCAKILEHVFKYQNQKLITMAVSSTGPEPITDQLIFDANLDDAQTKAAKWILAAWIRACTAFSGVLLIRVQSPDENQKDIVFGFQFLYNRIIALNPKDLQNHFENDDEPCPPSEYIKHEINTTFRLAFPVQPGA